MVRSLLAAGIRVAGVDRDRDPLGALAERAREQGKTSELLTIQTDLTTDTAADEITGATRARFGRIDILVNNAGIGPGAIRPDSWQRPLKFWEITPDQWRRFVAVHTTAPLALTNAVVPENDAPGLGPHRQCHDQPRDNVARRLPDLRPIQGRRSRRSAQLWRRTSTAPE